MACRRRTATIASAQFYIVAAVARRSGGRGRSSTATPSRCSTTSATSPGEAGEPEGLYHRDTRFLSRLRLLIDGTRPLLLSSTVRNDNAC